MEELPQFTRVILRLIYLLELFVLLTVDPLHGLDLRVQLLVLFLGLSQFVYEAVDLVKAEHVAVSVKLLLLDDLALVRNRLVCE